jgi:hypothetical protein
MASCPKGVRIFFGPSVPAVDVRYLKSGVKNVISLTHNAIVWRVARGERQGRIDNVLSLMRPPVNSQHSQVSNHHRRAPCSLIHICKIPNGMLNAI